MTMPKAGGDRLTADLVGACFAAIERAAIAGERCPVSNGPDADPAFYRNGVSALARAGRIRIEIYAHNFRRITILTGPHAGKSTAAAPKGLKPWKIVDTETRYPRKLVGCHEPRQQPAATRPLNSKEIGR